jgi:hypothetical protein
MEVSSNQVKSKPKNLAKNGKPKLSKAEIEAKIMARFGDKAQKKVAPEKPKVEISNSAKDSVEEVTTGDIGTNNPDSDITQEKLKSILKSGGFGFNDRERKVLANILK